MGYGTRVNDVIRFYVEIQYFIFYVTMMVYAKYNDVVRSYIFCYVTMPSISYFNFIAH